VRSTPQAAALKIGRFSFGKMFRDEIGKRLDFLAFSDFRKNAQFRGYRGPAVWTTSPNHDEPLRASITISIKVSNFAQTNGRVPVHSGPLF
jgi:hypothetical protein